MQQNDSLADGYSFPSRTHSAFTSSSTKSHSGIAAASLPAVGANAGAGTQTQRGNMRMPGLKK